MSQPTTSLPIQLSDKPLHRYAGWLLAIALGSLFLTASSYISIPMWPVPITMQTLAVVLVGAVFGWKLGGATILAWLAEGALGLPVFAGGAGGLAVFMGPTAGYIFSFPLIGMLAGWLVARGWDGSRPLLAFVGMAVAQTLCLIIGALWLAAMIGPQKAWAVGFVPFLIGDVVKSAMAAATLVLWHTAKPRRTTKQ
ncbi:MAG: biotin transporter BioY [Brachymonas sp.]|nr:biotin transporter BioY [Brachymonas sp.]